MAVSVGPARSAISSINVTPMADIMIVLLIIFLVVTPLLDDDLHLKLPEARHGRPDPSGPVSVSLRRDGTLALGDEPIGSAEELEIRLGSLLSSAPEGRRIVALEADRQLRYAEVGPILDRCRAAGAEHVALVVSVARPGS